jgi:predicted ribosomally synthesized peptide with nif11-like leader
MRTIKDFKEKLIADAEFAAKFKDAKTAEEIVDLAKAEGFDISVANLWELSDEELENAAGGLKINLPIDIIKPRP